MEYDAIVVGSGIAGLTATAYLSKSRPAYPAVREGTILRRTDQLFRAGWLRL